MKERPAEPEVTTLARAIIEARRRGTRINAVAADEAPADVAAAISVQAEVAAGLGETPGGWKVSIAPIGPVCAPMFASTVVASGAARPLGPPGPSAIEVEFAVRLRRDLAGARGARPGRDEIRSAIGTLLVGIELIESRLEDHQRQPFTAFVADNMANGGYVVGTEIPFDAAADLTGRRCRVDLGGVILFDGVAVHGNGDPLAPLFDCADVVGEAFGGWRAGQIVTTGSICGVLPIAGPGRVTARLEGIGEASVTLT